VRRGARFEHLASSVVVMTLPAEFQVSHQQRQLTARITTYSAHLSLDVIVGAILWLSFNDQHDSTFV
jgi:hypothetical protein